MHLNKLEMEGNICIGFIKPDILVEVVKRHKYIHCVIYTFKEYSFYQKCYKTQIERMGIKNIL